MWEHIDSAYKKHLAGRLVYHEFPPHLPKANPVQAAASSAPRHLSSFRSSDHSDVNDADLKIFVGQIPFEMSEARTRYLLYTATKGTVRAKSVTKLSRGCCFVILNNQAEVAAVRELEGYLLCDYNGFWLAESEEQRSFMNAFILAVSVPRLPKKWVTFEAPRPLAIPQFNSGPPSISSPPGKMPSYHLSISPSPLANPSARHNGTLSTPFRVTPPPTYRDFTPTSPDTPRSK